jgi:hypothetical protein
MDASDKQKTVCWLIGPIKNEIVDKFTPPNWVYHIQYLQQLNE